MNTETRKHAEEKPPYERKSKYREELLDEEALQDLVGEDDGGGVLDDYPDEPGNEEEQPVSERTKRGRKP